MNKGIYHRLALHNIRKNKNTFIPFSLSCIAMTALFYICYSIQLSVDDSIFAGAGAMREILRYGTIFCGIFSVVVIFYTNNFLIKKRQKEFGLYNILGMEKKHIIKVVFWENAAVGAGSIFAGLLAGALFAKLVFMVLLKILRLKTDFAFGLSKEAFLLTLLLFTGIFVLTMAAGSIRVCCLKPLELIQGASQGEREPKAKWLLALIGLVCLGSGYSMALTIEDPVKAIDIFLIAVLFVTAGTYLLFMSGSIVLLKLLKNNKRYYYQKNHFITVSGMMYRMKQNAVGLSNICILSTAVLVTLSSTVSLYVGMEDILRTNYPRDVLTDYSYYGDGLQFGSGEENDYSVLEDVLEKRAEDYHVTMRNVEKYYHYSKIGILEGNSYSTKYEGNPQQLQGVIQLQLMTLEDYNVWMNTNYEKEPGKLWIYFPGERETGEDTIKIAGKEYAVCGELEKGKSKYPLDDFGDQMWLIVPDLEVMKEIKDAIDGENNGIGVPIYYNFNFDLKGKYEDKKAFCADLEQVIRQTGISGTVKDVHTQRESILQLYGSLFFIGIFMGILFIITTAMIVYYKQVSEGYDDRERFAIMQKVGMSNAETKSVIRSQILQVFFFPVLFAVIHIVAAFKIVKEMLLVFGLTNVPLLIICTAATVVVFFIVYGTVYGVTARTYYRIVNDR